MWDVILISVFLIIVLPLLIYLCVQAGTFGYYRGKDMTNQNDRKESKQCQKD